MTYEIALLLSILVAAIVFFAIESVPADVVALGVLLVLILSGILTPDQAFAGFGSDTVLMILGLLILTAVLVRTGVVEMSGRFLLRHVGKSPKRLLFVVMIASSGMSAFMSNTACTAFFLPIVIGIAKRAKISPSKLLLPLAFASILSSSVSLVSTSTNVVVSGLIKAHGLAPMGMFELAPVGIPIALVGLVYMWFIGRRMIPERARAEDSADLFSAAAFLTELVILPRSPWIGGTLAEARVEQALDLTVVRVIRGKRQFLNPSTDIELQEGDVLLVEGARDDILKIKDVVGVDIKADVKLSDPMLQTEEIGLVEAILLRRSPLIGGTLKSFRFRDRYGLQVLAINRHGETLSRKISEVTLRMGDVLLVQGQRSNISALDEDHTFRILFAIDKPRANVKKARLAIAIFAGALLLSTFNVLPLAVSVLLGTMLAFVTKCITPQEAYREVEWKAVILIACMLALGTAMATTGTARYLAGHMVALFGGGHPLILLSAFFVMTVLLTQPMSNQAAAIVIVPIAIQSAEQLGFNPRTFAMMVAVAASCSYLTPLEPSCLMVYGPGKYRFSDFFKVGVGLTALIWLLAAWLVPKYWPI